MPFYLLATLLLFFLNATCEKKSDLEKKFQIQGHFARKR